ncbi:MAG: transcription elongation factor GreA [Fibrobacteria bacterium]|nr:transcription elongation factor GreA [Fibrobacteria bacterium]
MSGQRLPMSQATYDKLKIKLATLKAEDRPAIIKEIAEARAQGDLAENAEYHAAKEKQGMIEHEIAVIEDKLARVEIIKVSAADSEHVIFGANVKVKNLDSGAVLEYTLVSPDGMDIANNKISAKSPIGRGLMGKKVGDSVTIETPKGIQRLEILSFS